MTLLERFGVGREEEDEVKALGLSSWKDGPPSCRGGQPVMQACGGGESGVGRGQCEVPVTHPRAEGRREAGQTGPDFTGEAG